MVIRSAPEREGMGRASVLTEVNRDRPERPGGTPSQLRDSAGLGPKDHTGLSSLPPQAQVRGTR